MKKLKGILLVFLLCMLLPIQSLAAIPSTHMDAFYVNDFANVISEAAVDEMIALGAALEDACGAQVVAVTVEFLEGLDIDEYGAQLYEKWKLGQVDKDNGVLILLAVGDREIGTTLGTGLEGKLSYATIGSYIDDYFIPYAENENYSKGMLEVYRAHCNKIASIYGVSLNKASNNNQSNQEYSVGGGVGVVGAIFAIIVLLIIFSIIRTAFRGVGRMGRPRGYGWFGPGWFGPGWFWPRTRHHGPHHPPHMGPPPHSQPPRGHGPSGSPPGRTGGGSGKTFGGGVNRSFGGGSSSKPFGGSFGGGSRSFGGGSKPSGRTGGGSGKSFGGGPSRKF